MKLSPRNVIIAVVVVIVAVAIVYSFFGRSTAKYEQRNLSDVITLAKSGQISKIDVTGSTLTVTLKDGTKFTSRKEENVSIVDVLSNAGVQLGGEGGIVISVHRPGLGGGILNIVISFLPLIIFAGMIFFLVRWAMRRREPPAV